MLPNLVTFFSTRVNSIMSEMEAPLKILNGKVDDYKGWIFEDKQNYENPANDVDLDKWKKIRNQAVHVREVMQRFEMIKKAKKECCCKKNK